MCDISQAVINDIAAKPSSRAALILKQLGDYKRAPRGLTQSWQSTNQDPSGRIFLAEGGFPTWFAYSLTKNAAEHHSHFAGKAECRRLISQLASESEDSLKRLANEVASHIPASTIGRLQRLYDKTIRPTENNDQQHPSNKRRRTTDEDSTSEVQHSTITPGSSRSHSPVEEASLSLTQKLFEIPDRFAEHKQVLVNASLTATIRLFPPYLASAVKRIIKPGSEDALVAAISMSFPNASFMDKFWCQMSLEIMDNKIERVAWELFGAHLETTAGLRYVCLPGGAKVLPNPHFTLRGCQRDIISSFFGREMSRGIEESPTYQDEIKRACACTDCVSMVISQRSQDGAILFLSLGLREGALLSEKLYD